MSFVLEAEILRSDSQAAVDLADGVLKAVAHLFGCLDWISAQ
jgi:hypothetical protein